MLATETRTELQLNGTAASESPTIDRYLPSRVYLRLFYRREGASWTVLNLHPQRRSTRGQPFRTPSWYRAVRSCSHVTQSHELDPLVPLFPAACYIPQTETPSEIGGTKPTGPGTKRFAVSPCNVSSPRTSYREAGLRGCYAVWEVLRHQWTW